MLIKEYRICMPMTVPEFELAHLWGVAQQSREETGGGNGVEILRNEPFSGHMLLNGYDTGQYTLKNYHIANSVPRWVRLLLPAAAFVLREECWNAYPYCRTIITNEFMGERFMIKVETICLPDTGFTANAHNLPPEKLGREVVHINIAFPPSDVDVDPGFDPATFRSEKTGRGPLEQREWAITADPVMCIYKLVTAEFRVFGAQTRVENMIHHNEHRLFTVYHRKLFCWTDQWYGLVMADIRQIELDTERELEELRKAEGLRGMQVQEQRR